MRLPLLLAVLLALIFGPVGTAFAHAQLLSTVPAENAVADTAPQAVELTFNEPVTPLAVRLIEPDGGGLDLTGETTGGGVTRVALPDGIAKGTHVLSWRVVSADGHPVAGSLVFSVGVVSGGGVVAPTGDAVVSALLWAFKVLLFVALFVGVGGAAFTLVAPLPPASRKVALGLAGGGLVVGPVTLGLQGLDALGLPLRAIFGGDVWAAGFATSYGATAIAAMGAFALAVGALAWGRFPRLLGGLAAITAALSLVLSGHASAASPQWLTRPAVFLHIGGVMFWVGALLPLWILLRERSEAAERALASFSKAIPFAVTPLVLSGLTLAVIQLGAPGPSWATPYGFILAGKLGLLAVLFGLAVWNRFWLTRPAVAGNVVARRRLRRSLGWEMVLIGVILALVAGWRFTPPPRALAEAPVAVAAEPITEHFITGETMAMVTIAPGAAGPVVMDIMVSDLEHMPKAALEVGVTLSNPALGIEPIHHAAMEVEGIWRVEGLTIPVAGIWQVEIEARLGRFEMVKLAGSVAVP